MGGIIPRQVDLGYVTEVAKQTSEQYSSMVSALGSMLTSFNDGL